MFPYVDKIAWAAKQVPLMHVRGPVPLPRRIIKRGVLKSPFKYGKSREAWEVRWHSRMIVYETDSATHDKFLKFLDEVLEPVVAVKVTDHSFHDLDHFYRGQLFQWQQQQQEE